MINATKKPSFVVHLDGYFDNPTGDFAIEREAVEQAGGVFVADRDREQARRLARDATVVMFRAEAIDRCFIDGLKHCRALVRYGIGLDKVDIPAATARGIAVCNVPDFCTQEMADHTMAMALPLFRHLNEYGNAAKAGDWKLTRELPLRSAESCCFGTVGFGRIAQAVLQRAGAFAFRLIASDPFVEPETMQAQGVQDVGLDELFATADIVSLHCPLTDETEGLVDRQRLASMRPDTVLINTSRGGLVDTEALSQALAAGRLGGAGLDVTDPEPLPAGHRLYSFTNVIISPHMAWYSEQADVRLKQYAAREAARALLGEPLHYQRNETI